MHRKTLGIERSTPPRCGQAERSFQQGRRSLEAGRAAKTARAIARARQSAPAWPMAVIVSNGRVAERAAAGRGGEDQVAVVGGVGRHEGAGHAVLRRLGKTPGARLVERRVGRDDGDGGVAGAAHGPRLPRQGDRRVVSGAGRAEAAELAALLEGPCPELATAGCRGAAEGVDRGERADGDPALEHVGGRANAAHQRAGHRAQTRAGAAEGEIVLRGLERGRPEAAVRVRLPRLVAAVQEVEEDRRGHDRHNHVADPEAAAACPERVGDARGRVEAEGRAAGEHERVHLRDQPVRREQVGLPCPRRAAHDVDRRDEGRLAEHDRDARLQPVTASLADGEALDIGDEVPLTRPHQYPAARIGRSLGSPGAA
jgi:hypothetical protein